jgi:hypothetical protein
MNNEMKLRAIERGKSIARVLIAGGIYALWVLLTGLYIPCPIRTVTGYLCPGCGISHYFIHLLHFDFKQAFTDNQLIFILMPFACLYYLYRSWMYIKYEKTDYSKWEMVLFVVLFYCCIGFAVWRNMN